MPTRTVRYPAHLAQRLGWQELLYYFNIEKYEPMLSDLLSDNPRQKQIIVHLNRLVRLSPFDEDIDEVKVDRIYNVCGILKSLNSPFIPFPDVDGIIGFEDWERKVAPVEMWSVKDIVKMCEIAYGKVGVMFEGKVRYSVGDVRDMLDDLVLLGRVYEYFCDDLSNGRDCFFERQSDVRVKVLVVKYPPYLNAVSDDETTIDYEYVL